MTKKKGLIILILYLIVFTSIYIGYNNHSMISGSTSNNHDLLIFNKVLSGSEDDFGKGVCFDNNGNIIAVGSTESDDFSTKSAYDSTHNGGEDIFIAKFSAGGSLLWSTYFGGIEQDEVTGIDVDNGNNIIIIGYTRSDDFPTKNAYDSTHNGAEDIFIAKLSAGGSLIWSTYFGHDNDNPYTGKNERGHGISVDSKNNIYITGLASTSTFPALNAYNSTYGGLGDGFLSKFSSSGLLLWSTFLGGSESDVGIKVAVDNEDNVIITGRTESNDFIFEEEFSGMTFDTLVFTMRFSSTGEMEWAAALGGGEDYAMDVAVDSNNDVIITGYTNNENFPVTNAYDSTHEKRSKYAYAPDAFISKYSSKSGKLIWSTFLGGYDDDEARAIAIDNKNNIIITGTTESDDFPLLLAYESEHGDGEFFTNDDIFISKFSPNGSLLWSSYLGGRLSDRSNDLAIDNDNNVLLTGGIIPRSGYQSNNATILYLYDPLEDQDNDGMPNLWEVQNGLMLRIDDANDDKDGDGLTNIQEYLVGTNINDKDTDGDFVSDKEEVELGTDPLKFFSNPWLVPLFTSLFIILITISGVIIGYKVKEARTDYVEKREKFRRKKRDQEIKFEQILSTCSANFGVAIKTVQDHNFKIAMKLFKDIDHDLELAENRVITDELKSKIQEKRSDFNLNQKIGYLVILNKYPQILKEKKALQDKVREGNLSETLQSAEQVMKAINKAYIAAKNFELPLQGSLKEHILEVEQFNLKIQSKISTLIEEMQFSVQPSPSVRQTGSENHFSCQLCQEKHSKSQPYYKCQLCGREECLDCYVKSVELGKNTCLYCDSALEYQAQMEIEDIKK